jgi:hypothetical protein
MDGPAMNERDPRIEALLRQGPPEEDTYQVPPLGGAPRSRAGAERVGRGEIRFGARGSGPGQPGGGRTVRIALLAAALATAGFGASLFALSAGRAPDRQPTPSATVARTSSPSAVAAVSSPSPGLSPTATAAGAWPPPALLHSTVKTTTGTVEIGDTLVATDADGPAMLFRVRAVQVVDTVPGLTSSAPGMEFFDVTIDAYVQRQVIDLPFMWKTIGAVEVHTASWPVDRLQEQLLPAGLSTWHLGIEAPRGGEVTWSPMLTRDLGNVRLRAAIATSSAPPVAPGEWTGLSWNDPVTLPLPAGGHDAAPVGVLPWNGGYVAIGTGNRSSGGDESANFVTAWYSADGLTWTNTLADNPGKGHSQVRFLRTVGDRLVAIGTSGVDHCSGDGPGQACDALPVMTWISTDGRAWTRQASPPSMKGAALGDVAGDGTRLVAVGDLGYGKPRIWTSGDGIAWAAVATPTDTFADAGFEGVVAWRGGWISVGEIGGTEPVCCAGPGRGGTAVAWHSADGLTWQRATTTPAQSTAGSFDGLHAGSDGVAAIEAPSGDLGGLETILWTTSDGTTWTQTPDPNSTGQFGEFASDGRLILRTASTETGPVTMAVSRDGATWRDLVNTGAVAAAPTDFGGAVYLTALSLTSNGLIAVGYGPGTSGVVAWLADAVTAP